MRIFIGVSLPGDLCDEIAKIQDKYKKLLEKQVSINWIKKENLHITIIPPWEEESLDAVTKKLNQNPPHMRPFMTTFTSISYQPERDRRMIWLEGSTPPGIVILQDQLQRALGKPIESRKFRFHITLAKFNPRYFSTFKIKYIDEKVHLPLQLSELTIFQSLLSANSSDYKSLATFSLVKASLSS